MLLIRHICQLYLFRLNHIKKHPNSYESGRLASEISVWGVSDVINLIEKISIDWSIYTVFVFFWYWLDNENIKSNKLLNAIR